MKVLLTGVNGFIGSYLAKKWTQGQENFELICVSRSSISPGIKSQIVYADLANSFDFKEPVDVIVHAAAQSPAPGVTISDYIRNNVDGLRNIIKYARDIQVSKIIFLSSMLLYGEVQSPVVDETTPMINPDNYGLTKCIGERLLDEAAEIPSIALRLPGVLGEKARSGPWLVNTVHQLIRNQKVEIYNPEATFNNMAHISDIERFIHQLISQQSWTGPEKVVLGCEEYVKIQEIIDFYKRYFKSTSEVKIIDSNRGSFTISITKALNMGYKSMPARELLQTFAEEVSKDISP